MSDDCSSTSGIRSSGNVEPAAIRQACRRAGIGKLLILTACAWLGLTLPSQAAKAPLSESALQSSAELVVEGVVTELSIAAEPSRYERGFGNSDWGIDLTLDVDQVIKGEYPDAKITAHCFRIRARRTSLEFLSPGGNRPIPDRGARVVAYLEQLDGSWHVIHPNGLQSPSDSELVDAPAVEALAGGRYTYGLPLEVLGLLLVLMLLAGIGDVVRRIWRANRQLGPSGSSTEEPVRSA